MIKKIVLRFFLHSKKGFKNYLKTEGLSQIRKKISRLHNEYILISDEKIFNESKKKIFNQYLGQKLLYQRFIWTFFYFFSKKKKIIFPLPKEWQNSLKDDGTKVNSFLCTISYYFLLIYFFILGLMFFFKKIIKYFYYYFFYKKNLSFNKFTIFFGINSKKINLNSRSQYNIHNWYLKKIDPTAKIVFISKNNKNIVRSENLAEAENEFFLFHKNFNLTKFIFLFFKSVFEFRKISLLQYNLLLFKEIIELNFYQSSNLKSIDKALFIWTNNIYKPLWTYELEKQGIQVSILFNGFLNEIRLNKDLNFSYDHEGLSKLTWNNYISWDNSTSEFLKEKVDKKINIRVSGPMSFADNEKKFYIPERSVAIFGYENHKQNIGINTITDYEYCAKNFLEKFYEDIYDVSHKLNFNIIIKRKNNLKKLEIKKNKFFFNNFLKRPKVISIDPDISAFRVIKKSFLNISMPFTSTALIGSYYEKNTIYYDPFDWIQRDDPSGSNIKLISGKSNLENYFKTLKH